MSGAPQQEIAQRIMDWQRGSPRGPYTLELYPTLRCNLDCAFCDTTFRKKRADDELTPERYLRLADEAASLGVRRCYVLGGGEPMVARDITPPLMSRLKAHGIYGILGTNGTLFHTDFLEEIVKMGWDEVHFSLDGATPDINDRLRGQAGVFKRVTDVVRKLNDIKAAQGANLPRLLLHFVVTRLNHHQLEDMVVLADTLGCFRVNFDALIAYRPEQQSLVLSQKERARLPELAEAGVRRARTLNLETTLDQFLVSRTLDRGDMVFSESPVHDILHASCLNPWHHIVIQHNGKVGPCCVIPPEDEADDVRERSLESVWFEGKTFLDVRNQLIEQNLTRHCRNCSMSIISQNDAIRDHFTDR